MPESWNLLTFATFQDYIARPDAYDLTRTVLETPVQHPPLSESLSPSDSIAILIEDSSRYSPKQRVLKALLQELAAIPCFRRQDN